MIYPADITAASEDIARRVLVYARSIAPTLDSLSGEAKADAIAILNGIAAEVPEPGEARIQSERGGEVTVTYRAIATYFGPDDRKGLRSLCAAAPALGLPRGSFPPPSVVSRLWPEGEYS